MGEIIGGWDKPEVATAQYDLVLKELSADPMTIGPYAAFRWAMEIVRRDWPDYGIIANSLLDAGCGVGHYGVLCERFYPGIRYHGTDISQAMIEQAKQLAPLSTFSVCDFKDNDFGDYDIILAGQVVEQLDNPPGNLELLLTLAKRYVILNRIRLTHVAESHRIEEVTYCGEMGRNWLWNREDITRRIEEHAQIIAVNDQWASDQMTFVVKRREMDEMLDFQNQLVEKGRRIGKIPWTCDGNMQTLIAGILQKEGIFTYESMEESLNEQPTELGGCACSTSGACSCACA